MYVVCLCVRSLFCGGAFVVFVCLIVCFILGKKRGGGEQHEISGSVMVKARQVSDVSVFHFVPCR